MGELYECGDVKMKRNIIGSIFLKNLRFDEINYRTVRINEAVWLIYNMGAGFSEKKIGQIEEISTCPIG
jgi:hypothetical protein